MILKAIHGTHDMKSEHDLANTVIGDIAEYSHREMTVREFYDGSSPAEVSLRWLVDPGIGNDVIVRVMRLTLRDREEMIAIVLPGWAYMMNDRGDTIEKI